jgi:threonine synthase
MVRAHRQLQRSWRFGYGFHPAATRHRPHPGGQLRQRRSRHRRLRRGRRHAGENPGACLYSTGKNNSNASLWRRGGTGAGHNAKQIFYASHNWQAFFLQGTKTLAYELWEDLDFRAPDNVIIPTGAGSNVLGCDIGFGELLRHREIARLPKIFAVQPENCAPIHASFAAGGDQLVPVEARPTIAEGTSITHPVRLKQVLEAIRLSQGATVTVSEQEIIAALRELAATGLYAEPTSAIAGAALSKLLAAGAIRPNETTVVVLTGSGLKATQRIGELVGVQ